MLINRIFIFFNLQKKLNVPVAMIATFMTINLLHLTLLLLSEAIIHKFQNGTLKLIFFNQIYNFEKINKNDSM